MQIKSHLAMSDACFYISEAAQEAGRQAQETIEKAADKATNTIKEFGRRVDGKWAVKKNK